MAPLSSFTCGISEPEEPTVLATDSAGSPDNWIELKRKELVGAAKLAQLAPSEVIGSIRVSQESGALTPTEADALIIRQAYQYINAGLDVLSRAAPGISVDPDALVPELLALYDEEILSNILRTDFAAADQGSWRLVESIASESEDESPTSAAEYAAWRRTIEEIRAAGGPKTIDQVRNCMRPEARVKHLWWPGLAAYRQDVYNLIPVVRRGDVLAFAMIDTHEGPLPCNAIVLHWCRETSSYLPGVVGRSEAGLPTVATYPGSLTYAPVPFEEAEVAAYAIGHEWMNGTSTSRLMCEGPLVFGFDHDERSSNRPDFVMRDPEGLR